MKLCRQRLGCTTNLSALQEVLSSLMCDSSCGDDGHSLQNRAFGVGDFLAVQGRAVFPALLLTLHEGQMPANQPRSRINKLHLILGNGEGTGDTGCTAECQDAFEG